MSSVQVLYGVRAGAVDEVTVYPRLDPEGYPTEADFKDYEVLIYSTVDLSGTPTGSGEIQRLR